MTAFLDDDPLHSILLPLSRHHDDFTRNGLLPIVPTVPPALHSALELTSTLEAASNSPRISTFSRPVIGPCSEDPVPKATPTPALVTETWLPPTSRTEMASDSLFTAMDEEDPRDESTKATDATPPMVAELVVDPPLLSVSLLLSSRSAINVAVCPRIVTGDGGLAFATQNVDKPPAVTTP